MGIDRERLPEIDELTGKYVWQRRKGPTLAHVKGSESFTLQVGSHKLKVPVKDARWLAEVLLQLTDIYPEKYGDDSVLDDYNRPDILERDRR